MHESALFLLGLLVAESSVYHAVRSSIRCPPRSVYTCLYIYIYIYIYVHARIQHRSTRCETLHTHPGRVDTGERERGGWSSACERQLRSTSLLKGVWQIRWGNTDGSLVFCPSFLLFSLLSFFFSSFFSLSFWFRFVLFHFSVSGEMKEREREGRGTKNCADVWQRSWTSETNRRVTGIYLNLWERPVAATGRIFLFAD